MIFINYQNNNNKFNIVLGVIGLILSLFNQNEQFKSYINIKFKTGD